MPAAGVIMAPGAAAALMHKGAGYRRRLGRAPGVAGVNQENQRAPRFYASWFQDQRHQDVLTEEPTNDYVMNSRAV